MIQINYDVQWVFDRLLATGDENAVVQAAACRRPSSMRITTVRHDERENIHPDQSVVEGSLARFEQSVTTGWESRASIFALPLKC